MDIKKVSEEKQNERGASLVEYALLVALIAVVAISSIRVLGRSVSEKFSAVGVQINQP